MNGVSASEAAKLWGCTPRHIQWLAQQGELRVIGYRPGSTTLLTNNCAMVTRVALYDPAEVLKLRAVKRANRAENARKLHTYNRTKNWAGAVAIAKRLGKVWQRMPAAEKAKWGRDWRHGAYLWMTRRSREQVA